ncbi:MAG: LysR family transcriptional regulator [Eubacteriales bacterium]
MNILHLKYAVEVAKTKSISKAAENLYMGQPNLSRAIKELEESLGIVIFERTTKGITVTPDGEEFLQYAKRIIRQVDEIEELYKSARTQKQRFSACVPRASYISHAFAAFAKEIDAASPAEIFYKESNSMRAIDCVAKEEFNLGIVRYQTVFEPYFERKFDEKGLVSTTICEFPYVLLVSENSPLTKKSKIESRDLADYIEISHPDPYVPSLPLPDVRKAEFSEFVDKRIYVFERASQFALLESVPNTFMWVSPVPDELLSKYHLVFLRTESAKRHKDVLIYRKDYKLTPLDNRFVDQVICAKRTFIDA